MTTTTVPLEGGRELAVESYGPDDGHPVFLMHGTPGSRLGPRPRGILLQRLGIRLISYDRPGYGGSTRWQNRSVADAAEDVRAIADHLGFQKFSVVGRSGGGPHALACAALLSHRITKVAVLVTLAPSDADGLDWYDGMGDWNKREYRHLDEDDSGSLTVIVQNGKAIQGDPSGLLDNLQDELTKSDERVVGEVMIREQLTDTYRESVQQGSAGWLDDVLAFRRPWGFDLAKIDDAVPVLFWHGNEDRFSPVHHTRWLAKRVEHAELWVERGASHFDAIEVLPTVLAWIAARDPFRRFSDLRAFERG